MGLFSGIGRALRGVGRAIDPTNAHSLVRRGVRELDPTRKASAMAGIGRQLDVTNKNSLAGKIAPYAVGAIPGIGMPLAAGLGAGLRASQAVGRGDYGDIMGDALKGAGQASLVRGVAQGLMPGTFAAKAPVGGVAPPASELFSAGAPASPTATIPPVGGWDSGLSLGGGAAPSAGINPLPLDLARTGSGVAPGGGTLGGIGRFLTRQPTTIPSILQTGASMYGASQTGAAEDERLRMERERYDEERQRRANRIGFDAWRRRRTAQGSAPTV